MADGPPQIRKTDGTVEPFDERKLRRSLQRAGADPAEIDHVADAVRRSLRDGMTTNALYRVAFDHLRRARKPTAARYSLQRAIVRLGPSGYPFEHFVAGLFASEGWTTKTGVQLEGRFVSHDIDVVGRRRGERFLAECKFRTQHDGKTDVKVAMYVYARSVDLRSIEGGYEDFWLITNGRFTTDALRYGEGMGLRMMSWNHPYGEGIKDWIDGAGLHPITCLTTLKGKEKRALIRRGVVLARSLHEHPDALADLGASPRRRDNILEEADSLTATGSTP